jgi:hypothetical protein
VANQILLCSAIRFDGQVNRWMLVERQDTNLPRFRRAASWSEDAIKSASSKEWLEAEADQ